MDLSKLSDSDLLALKSGKLSNVSTEGLMALKEAHQINPAKQDVGMVEGALMGVPRGVKDVIDTGAQLLASGFDKIAGTKEGERVRAMNDAGKAEFNQKYGGSTSAALSRIGGNILATAPLTSFLGAATGAAGLPALGNAISSGGMTLGNTTGNAAANMAIRSAGGALAGGLSAGAVEPSSAGTGAVIGGLLPPVAKGVYEGGKVVGNVFKPFYSKGQDWIAGKVLSQSAANPQALLGVESVPAVIPGSIPTTVMAAGDDGLAGLNRTMQSVDPKYAAELSSRQAAQNSARTAALENVAGNTGKIALAKEARDAATSAMRESVLDAAGNVPARPILSSIDRMIASPNNAGELAQQALNKFRTRIAQFSPDGQINARALYEIRKDINTLLEGRLQGEAGNLRYASGQLAKVKGVIDDAIDQASRVVGQSESRALMPGGSNMTRAGEAAAYGSMAPRPSWRQYLQEYSSQSRPIERMEILDDILKNVQTGTVDKSGNAILSAAKLNNIMKNRGQELAEKLDPTQLELLRNLAADLNASQLANFSGKAVGSNTVQNAAGANLLTMLLGNKVGNSTPVTSTLGQLLRLPYGAANKQITEKIGNGLLNPEEAARLREIYTATGNKRLAELLSPAAQIGYRAAPLIPAQ